MLARTIRVTFDFGACEHAPYDEGSDMEYGLPKGFRFAGVHCGIKTNPNNTDLTLVVSDVAAVASGVYTQNLVFAAPVAVDRTRTPSDAIRAIVVNSGNANACTGERGLEDARRMAELASAVCSAPPEAGLVMSTGIIGVFLPMEKIEKGIASAAGRLGADADSFDAAARGILTTDTAAKVSARALTIGGKEVRIVGMAKGAAMIGPNMATMLGLILTDATLAKEDAQAVLGSAVDDSFNCISVEGHTSTNDTVLLLANSRSETAPLGGDDLAAFAAAIAEVCQELAKSIPADGEGATHLITIKVNGAAGRDEAFEIAKTVANSVLVKTAVTGADPNWGRIVSAAGYAGVPFDPAKVNLQVNGIPLYEGGSPLQFDAEAASKSIAASRDTLIELQFGEGGGRARFWTTDLTAEYIRLNADYHT